MYSAVILAAGFSERMGTPKPFLRINNKTFLEGIIENLKKAGVDEIITILNPLHKDILKNIDIKNTHICYNPHAEQGQFSSLKIGIEYISPDAAAFFMCLVDYPLVKLETYISLLEAKKEKKPYIVIPKYQERKGHPVLFSADFLSIIKSAPLSYTAKNIVNMYANSVIFIDVDDKGILSDIDTKDEFDKAIKSTTKNMFR